MIPADPFQFAATVAELLDALAIPYVIGGSVASSFYGEPRSTLDLDIMIETDEATVRRLAEAMKNDFYVDVDDAVDAVRHGRSFNAIHFASAMKVDFFIAEDREEVRTQIARRRPFRTSDGRVVWFYAPEDIIVRKLVWFRMGGEQSERQWRDITGLLRLHEDLDVAYLENAAAQFGVRDLLDRARE